jgi:hypothetical protein
MPELSDIAAMVEAAMSKDANSKDANSKDANSKDANSKDAPRCEKTTLAPTALLLQPDLTMVQWAEDQWQQGHTWQSYRVQYVPYIA